MSDRRERELERAFQASGTPEDEAAWLLARLRRGDPVDACYGRVGALLARAADGEDVDDELLAWIYTLGLCHIRYPWLADRPAFAALGARIPTLRSLHWLEGAFGEIDRLLRDFTPYGDFYRWPDIPWRRSAIAFLSTLFRRHGLHQHTAALSLGLEEVDDQIQHVREVMGVFESEIPIGIPGGHWWWWNGPRGSVTGVKRGRCERPSPRRGGASPPKHPIQLRLPEEVLGRAT